jgi:hypothetical protein
MSRSTICALAALAFFSGSAARSQPEPPLRCTLRVDMTLSLEVPDATAPGFISSLVGNNTAYRILLIQLVDPNHIVADLNGPGPGDRCRHAMDAISHDARVWSIDVLSLSESASSSSD